MPSMPEPTKKKLTHHNGQYRASIGAERKPDGSRKPKVIMLGSDLRFARVKEKAWRDTWEVVVANYRRKGLKKTDAVWDDQWVELANTTTDALCGYVTDAMRWVNKFNALGDGTTPATIPASPSARPAEASKDAKAAVTLRTAVAAYDAKLDGDVASGERTPSNADRHKVSLRQFIRFIADAPYNPSSDPKLPARPEKRTEYLKAQFADPSPVADQPLDRLTYDQVAAFAINLKNRSVSGYAPDTIFTTCQHVGVFFGWLEESNRWRPTFSYQKLLKVNKAKLRTLAEQKQGNSGQDTFTADELAAIYRATEDNARWRLYLLLGLNLCATQQQLSDLLVADVIDLDGDAPSISFTRGKTRTLNKGAGVEGRYPLWDETADALRNWLADHPSTGDYLFRTEDGNPLVRYDAGAKGQSKVDSVRLAWDRVLTEAGADRVLDGKVRWLGFKFLRKTAGDAIKSLAGGGPRGEYFQQLALAHARDTVAGKHYSGSGSADVDFAELATLINRLRTETFAKMFERELVVV